MTRHSFGIGALTAALMLLGAGEPARTQVPVPTPKDSTVLRRYVYEVPSYQAAPPPYPSPYGSAWGRLYQPPPLGFGSPYYSGYNDPYSYSYGPGVREFLRFGGADFYGW